MKLNLYDIYGVLFDYGSIDIYSIGPIYMVEYQKHDKEAQKYFDTYSDAYKFFVRKLKELAGDSPLYDYYDSEVNLETIMWDLESYSSVSEIKTKVNTTIFKEWKTKPKFSFIAKNDEGRVVEFIAEFESDLGFDYPGLEYSISGFNIDAIYYFNGYTQKVESIAYILCKEEDIDAVKNIVKKIYTDKFIKVTQINLDNFLTKIPEFSEYTKISEIARKLKEQGFEIGWA